MDYRANAPKPQTFEVALVLAGAVMGGAYTAGVLDFLIEALDAWDAERGQPDVPGHHVVLRVVTGASAGSLAALAATWQLVARRPQDAENRPLHALWVREARAERLLGTGDLRGDELPSLCDGSGFAEALDAVFGGLQAGSLPTWVAPDLRVVLTATSLRGVPYATEYEGGSVHARTFADHFAFALGTDLPTTLGGPTDWSRLREAALASSAFPLVLPSRPFEAPLGAYRDRVRYRHLDTWKSVPPDWPPAMRDPYRSRYVDGGALDNTPLELARRLLAGGPDAKNPRLPGESDRAVILVNPFPGDGGTFPIGDPPASPSLLDDARAFASAVIYQSRFLPEEIRLALEPDVTSRFLVAPDRGDDGRGPLATAPLGSFAGALDPRIRQHDFDLGRRNCQRFLARWFTVAPDNPVFGQQTTPLADDATRAPLVPLLGSAKTPVPLPAWPKLDETELASRLRGPLGARTRGVLTALLRHPGVPLPRFLARPAAACLARPVAGRAWEAVLAELRRGRLFG